MATPNDVSKEAWEEISKITLETSVIVTGKMAKHPKKEEYELHINDLKIIQLAQEYPIGKKEHGPDFLLDHRHLWLRSQKQWAIQRVRNTVINATYEWFANNDFIKIDSPILTPNACEGTSTLFEIDYFGFDKAYLSQSGQLYLEAAVMSHGRVFDFGPVFRAEKSKTRRHLTEFWMMDAEMAYVDHNGNIEIQEQLIYHIVQRVLEKCKAELGILERDVSKLEAIKLPFKRMIHSDVVQLLQDKGSPIKDYDDLGAEDETLLTENETQPIFIEKYPANVKAFYMKRDPGNGRLALCSDLLAPEGYGEIIGGSEREDDFDTLVARLKEHNLPTEAFMWYLDLRKYGSVPHSGFGYGLERIVGWLSGTRHIRETIPFPRLINRLNP
ncbi:asparagine--tRNA ligase [bacterium]|nr:asparagine--tRNA ligase [bacterium]